MKLLVGLGRAARRAGARIHEDTRIEALSRGEGGLWQARTPRGTVTAARVLLATNAHGGRLEPRSAAHVMPIRSFIAATEPLAEPGRILTGNEAADDSRFVVRYFRKSVTVGSSSAAARPTPPPPATSPARSAARSSPSGRT